VKKSKWWCGSCFRIAESKMVKLEFIKNRFCLA
jgi:hypothetical protein